MGGHSLRFLNDDWNDSISNGEFFTLRWNQSLVKAGSQLGLFKVTYPKDGVVVYELVTNLTVVDRFDGHRVMRVHATRTEPGLVRDVAHHWATLAPQLDHIASLDPQRNSHQKLHWATPIIIPVVCLLVLYALCLTTCLVYRRRKKAKREKEDATSHQDVDRNGSVVSAITVQTLTEAYDGKEKPGDIWIFTNSSVETDITVGGVEEKDIADVERGEGDVHCIQDEQAIGIGL
ncbi:hypothetical protein TOPH_07540 [Tolypocladium ophioglossoides CBS 100239]|uniref:Uncharacterized protein n=1 Tax=Tolypocladium ophioglossoides (strain CBS 100239) TaxID=1163406 RepID=A0A0L0N105_TOLOC|nr:hypothetical protein TOPH_07540 [Tolypocladium ophioglossoides CBS 100239]